MTWVVVLDNGNHFTVQADSLFEINYNLMECGLIQSDYDIISITRTSDLLGSISRLRIAQYIPLGVPSTLPIMRLYKCAIST